MIMEHSTAAHQINRADFCSLEDELLVLDFATAYNLPLLRNPDGSANVKEFKQLLFPEDVECIDLPSSLSWNEEGCLVRNGIQCKTIPPPSILESFPDEDDSSDDEQSVAGVEGNGSPPSPPCITETTSWPEAQAEVNKQRDLRDAELKDLFALEARISTRSLAAMWDIRKLKKSGKKLMKAVKRYGGVAAARAMVERAEREVKARLPDDWDGNAHTKNDSSSDDEGADGPPPPPPGPGDGHSHNDDGDEDDDDDQPPHRPIAPRLIFPAPVVSQAPQNHWNAAAARSDQMTLNELLGSVGGGYPPRSTPSPRTPENHLHEPAPSSNQMTLNELLGSVGGGYPPRSTPSPRARENHLHEPAPSSDQMTLNELLRSVGGGYSSRSTPSPRAPENHLYAPTARSAQHTLADLLHTFDSGRTLPSTTPGPIQSIALPSPPSEPSEVEEGLELDSEEYISIHGAPYPVPPPPVPYVPPTDEEQDDLYTSDDNAVSEEVAASIVPLQSAPLAEDDDDLYTAHDPVPGASTAGPGDAAAFSIDDEDDLYAAHDPVPAPVASTSRPPIQSASTGDNDDDIYVTSDPVASTSRSGDAADSVQLQPVDSQLLLTASTPPTASTSDEAEVPSDIPGLGSLESPPSTSIRDEANDDGLPFADRTRRQEHRALIRAWERQMRLHPSWVHPPSRIVLDPPRRVKRFSKQFGVKRHSEYSAEMQRRAGEIVDLQLDRDNEQARDMIKLICADLQAQQDRWEERMARRHRLRRQTPAPQRQATPGPSRPRPSPAPSSRMMQIDHRGMRYSPFESASSRKRPHDEDEAADTTTSKRMRSHSAFSTPVGLPPSDARTSSSAPPTVLSRKRAREDDDDGISSHGEDTPREGVRSGLWSWISSPFRAMPPPPPPPLPRAPSPPAVSPSPPPIVHPMPWPPLQRRKHEPDALGPSQAGPSSMAIPYAPLPPPPKKLTREERHERARDRTRRQSENRRAVPRDWADTSVAGRNPAFFLDFDEFVDSEARGPVFDSEVKILKKYGRDYRPPAVLRAPPRRGNLQMAFTGFTNAMAHGFAFRAPTASTAPPPQPPAAAAAAAPTPYVAPPASPSVSPLPRQLNAFRLERPDPLDSEESTDDDEL